MTCSVHIPLRTVSEANQREHWAKRARRAKLHRGTVRTVLGAACAIPSPPLVVRLTRVAPRRLDCDNLRGALKACRDGVADWLGIDDGSEDITWEYEQTKGKPREYAVRVEVSAR